MAKGHSACGLGLDPCDLAPVGQCSLELSPSPVHPKVPCPPAGATGFWRQSKTWPPPLYPELCLVQAYIRRSEAVPGGFRCPCAGAESVTDASVWS